MSGKVICDHPEAEGDGMECITPDQCTYKEVENGGSVCVHALDNILPDREEVMEGELLAPESNVPATTEWSMLQYADWISASWRSSMEGILETGRRLVEAKSKLQHGEYLAMVKDKLPFGDTMALRLRRIATCPHFSNTDTYPHLPNSWNSLYHITTLTEDEFKKLVDTGHIKPNTTYREILQLKEAIKNKKSQARDPSPTSQADAGKKQIALPPPKPKRPNKIITVRLSASNAGLLLHLCRSKSIAESLRFWAESKNIDAAQELADIADILEAFGAPTI
ncbi:MAG: DUF3102 domain-containing protein [Magnetococcales bacterium]|nr:DUF3102 domain-containing protein [Magnetococcales bacterium]